MVSPGCERACWLQPLLLFGWNNGPIVAPTLANQGLGVFGILAAIIFVSRQVLASVEVVGESMLPTLAPGDRLLIIRIPAGETGFARAVRRHLITRGALIVLCPPALLGRSVVKRVDGLS